jgi:hypothetical protein
MSVIGRLRKRKTKMEGEVPGIGEKVTLKTILKICEHVN